MAGRGGALLFLLLLCFLGDAWTSDFAPVSLPIHQNVFVRVFAGVPGKHCMLRVHHTCNETIILFSVPHTYSKSFTKHDDQSGSEVFLLGQHALRLPVTFSTDILIIDHEEDGFSPTYNVQYEGIMCLGPHSVLWHYWSRYSYSITDLVLGVHNHHLDRLTYLPFSDRYDHPTQVFCPEVNAYYTLHYEPESTYSYLPDELYFYARNHNDHLTLHYEHGAHLTLNHHDFASRFPQYQFDYATVRRAHDNFTIVLGRQPLRKFVWHGDPINHHHQLCLLYDLFDIGNSQPAFNATVALMLTVAFCFWLAILYTEDLNDEQETMRERRTRALFLLEVFAYGACFLCLIIEHHGFAVQRYMDRHVASVHYYWPFLAFVCINIILGALNTGAYVTRPSQLAYRKATVETVLLLTLWLTQLDNRYSGIEQAFLMLIAALYSWVRNIAFFWHLSEWRKHPWHKHLALGFFALVSHVFLVMYNIEPIVRRFWYGFPDQAGMVMLLWFASSILVIVHAGIHFILADIQNDIIEEQQQQQESPSS